MTAMKNNSYYRKGIFTALFALITLLLQAQSQTVTTSSVCRLLADPANTSSVLKYVPEKVELEILGTKENHLLVSYEGTEGYITSEKVVFSEPVQKEQQPVTDYRTSLGGNDSIIVNYQTESYQQARYDILVQKYGERDAKALFEHKIWKGIDHNMVRDSWGKPVEIRREIKNGVINEEWIYRKHRLVFVNDVLTRWGPAR